MTSPTAIVVGAGIYGVTAALELRGRGWQVELLDPGPLPHPLAASTDINKAVRLDYGPDADYTALAETALAGWRQWNAEWRTPLFHETGVLFLTLAAFAPGGYEYESYRLLRERGHHLERLSPADIGQRFPAFGAGGYADGYFNPAGGFAQSGRVVERLVEQARAEGVGLRAGQAFERLIESGRRVSGVICRDGSRFQGDVVVAAAGAWTHHLVPEMRGALRSNGMPVFHLRPADAALFRAERFPVFTADVSTTGYYGFPIHPEAGVVKVAHHGRGRMMHPEAAERVVTGAETAELRAFLAEAIPALADAPIVSTRVCLYSDTWDGHFWIAPDPAREGLVVAAGGSGHAFKFAPVLGGLIADAVEGRPNPVLKKFRWRPEVHPPRSEEATRKQD